MQPDRTAELAALLEKRILLLDGAMGTMIQSYHLDEAGYRGACLAGHDHDYERFAPQTPDGTRDDARGIRQFVVGTGGTGFRSVSTPIANSETTNDDTFGVLKLTLSPGGYAWEFVPVAGGNPIDVMKGMDADSPSKPFGDSEEFTFTPDSRSVVFTARVADNTEPWSTNFDLYVSPVDGSSAPRNLTSANPAWDTAPVFSPDGKMLAFVSNTGTY